MVAIFPDADTAGVERFRARWDPLADAVPAHLTVVYPFHWPDPPDGLYDAVSAIASTCPSFRIELCRVTVWEHEYLFLLADEGRDAINDLHHRLYTDALPALRRPAIFEPHMTVGRCPHGPTQAAAIREAANMALPVCGVARTLSIYRVEPDGRRVREFDVQFDGR